MYNAQGFKVWSTAYDIYGRLRNLEGDREFIPFRQLGQYEDVELEGLYYNRFRYYDSNSGLYISKDPIGLAGNNPTMYAYVWDSNGQVDVFGLENMPLGSKENPFKSIKAAMNRAKELVGIPHSQQPKTQWVIGDDINKKGVEFENYLYSKDKGSQGRMFEFIDDKGHKKIVVIHTNDGQLHVHGGTAKNGADPRTYDFKENRYAKVDDPRLEDHHLYVECK